MTNNMSVIEQETTDAVGENRRTLTEETAKINRDPDLSDSAKARYVEEANQRARERHQEIVQEHEQAVAHRLEQNEKDLFRLSWPKDTLTDSQKEGFRSSYRQATFQLLDASEDTVSRAMSRALRTGDAVLAQAAYHESIERGLSEVGDEYRERYPKAKEKWKTYVTSRRAAESRQAILGGALLSSAGPS